jgi:hypothetical protein
MFAITFAISVELYNNQSYAVENYEKREERLVDQISQVLMLMLNNGAQDAELAEYMAGLEASGARFYVLSNEDTIIFAKNAVTSANLGNLSDSSLFFDSLQGQELTIQSASFKCELGEYRVYLIEDMYTVKSDLDLTRHFYYILMYTVILCFVVVALLISLLGYIRDIRKKLDAAQKELFERNEEMEKLSMEFSANEGDKTDIEGRNVGNGIVSSDALEFYNVYTIKMLLEKSVDPELKSVSIIFAELDMREKYFSKDELFDIMGNFKKQLKSNEIIGEVRKGLFVILLYRYNADEVESRLLDLEKTREDIFIRDSVRVSLRLVKPDDRLPIDRFNGYLNARL